MSAASDIAVAIIPVAGRGTRLGPVTRAVPKAMLPLVGPDGSVRPVADLIAREALAAGIERICFVTAPGQDGLLRSYFDGEADLSGRIEYVTDVLPLGLGYAVWAARAAAGGAAAMVLLGDHVHLPGPSGTAPAAEVADAFAAESPAAMIGVQVIAETQTSLVGICRGEPVGEDLYRCRQIVEKPGPEAAESLATPGLPRGNYLAHAGIYVFGPEIFDCLEALVAGCAEGDEVGLTEAEQALLARRPDEVLLRPINGRTLDVGTPDGYRDAMAAMVGAPDA